MKIPNTIIENYLTKIKPHYEDEVFSKILQESYDKDEAEKSAIEFYTPKNDGVVPNIKWIDSPLDLRDIYPSKEVQIFSTYFNINWVYFYFTFLDELKDTETEINPLYFNTEKYYKDSKLIFNIFINTFGVCEIPGFSEELKRTILYKEIILIKKPSNVSLVEDKLHSITGPSFSYPDKTLNFYYLEGIKFDEELWIKTIKTALNNPNSPVNDELKENKKNSLLKYISQVEERIGIQNELSVSEILMINNLELKSKVIKYVGINIVLNNCKIINEKSTTTHKGEIVNYQLIEMDLGLEIDKIPSRFVKVVCWSTGKEYILQVDPRNKQCESALGAIAWTCLKPDGNHCTEEEYLELEFQT